MCSLNIYYFYIIPFRNVTMVGHQEKLCFFYISSNACQYKNCNEFIIVNLNSSSWKIGSCQHWYHTHVGIYIKMSCFTVIPIPFITLPPTENVWLWSHSTVPFVLSTPSSSNIGQPFYDRTRGLFVIGNKSTTSIHNKTQRCWLVAITTTYRRRHRIVFRFPQCSNINRKIDELLFVFMSLTPAHA